MTVDEAVIEGDIIGNAPLIIFATPEGIPMNDERNLHVSIQTNPVVVDPASTNTSQSFIQVPLFKHVSPDDKVGSLARHVIYVTDV